MKKYFNLLAFIVFLIEPCWSFAAGFGFGSIENQVPIAPPSSATPSPPPGNGESIPSSQQKLSNSAKTLYIKKIVLRGHHIFDENTLRKIVAAYENKYLTFRQILGIAHEISAFYRAHNYAVDRAYIPKQIVKNGVLVIRIVETKLDSVNVVNHSRIRKELVDGTLSPQTGSDINTSDISRQLFLLSDLPGASVQSTLSPGKQPGTSALSVIVDPTPMFSGNVSVDNYGVPYLGALQLTANASLNNIFHNGDLLSVNMTTSMGGFNYGSLQFVTPLNGYGTKLGVGYSAMNYRMGLGFQPLGFENTSSYAAYSLLGSSGYGQVASIWLSQTLIRNEDTNITATMTYSYNDYTDSYTSLSGDQRTFSMEAFGVGGYRRDELMGGGTNTFSVNYSPYWLSASTSAFGTNPQAQLTSGFRGIWTGTLGRTQNLPGNNNTFSLNGSGQFSTGILDPMEQMMLGGYNSVRAFAMASLFGSDGFLASAQLSHTSKISWIPGYFESSLFFDDGAVSLVSSSGMDNIMGPGVEEKWNFSRYLASASIATPVGNYPGTIGSIPSIQVWFSAGLNF